MRFMFAACSGMLLMGLCSAAGAADAAAGKAKVDAICAECHEPADWAEEDVESLAAKIKSVVAGKVKHKKKLELTDEEIASIASYWAGSAK